MGTKAELKEVKGSFTEFRLWDPEIGRRHSEALADVSLLRGARDGCRAFDLWITGVLWAGGGESTVTPAPVV